MTERFTKRTIDNWESYIVDNETGKEYGSLIDPLLDLLNEIDKKYVDEFSLRETLQLEVQRLEGENKELKQELFESRRDYIIETADISDKLYIDDEIEKERKEIFGDVE